MRVSCVFNLLLLLFMMMMIYSHICTHAELNIQEHDDRIMVLLCKRPYQSSNPTFGCVRGIFLH